jgi:propanol-preferring alcohol dehydrogenase
MSTSLVAEPQVAVETTTMKAAVVHAFDEPLRIEQVAKTTAGPGEIVVRIEASGLCHTDIHAAHGDWPVKPTPPFTPGHEGIGIVETVGFGVTEVAVGDRVAIPWLGYACGTCEYCISGWETLCLEQRNTGYSVDGGFAEYVLATACLFAYYLGKRANAIYHAQSDGFISTDHAPLAETAAHI